MAATPPLYRPPMPPRRSSSHIIVIALLVLALIVTGAVLALVYGARVISRNITVHERQSPAGNKEVSIKTPVGNINIHKGWLMDATMVGLPVYPGARQIQDRKAPRVWVNLPGIESVDFVAAHFETADSIGKVKDYYQTQLNGQTTKFSATDFDTKIVFEIKQDNQEKVVALKSNGGGTEITLVRVLHGTGEAN